MARKFSVGIIAVLLCVIITVPTFAQQVDVKLEYNLSDFYSICEKIETKNGSNLFLNEIIVAGSKCTALYSDTHYVQESLPQTLANYKKNILKKYTAFSDIPQSMEYTEYNDEHGVWFSGTLNIVKTVRHGTIWHATFSGELLGQI